MLEEVPCVLLMVDSPRILGRSLLLGIAKYSRLHGPWLLINEPGRQEKTEHQVARIAPDGIIVNENPRIAEIIRLGIPTIVMPDEHSEFSNGHVLHVNNTLIGGMAAEYLIGLRLKNFAFCGFTDRFWSLERKESFVDTINKAGFEAIVYDRRSTKLLSTASSEIERLIKWLRLLPKPVGIMACVDDCGRHVLDACRIAKIRVPEEVAVIGVDNDDLVCEIANPPLTSIELNFEIAGYEAARLLSHLMNGQQLSPHPVVIQPVRIVERRSTETLALSDTEVAAAIRYIRKNFREELSVDIVADAVMLSRRVLERRFRKYLNWSILQEINNIRISHSIQLLVETRMSIEEIALSVGFSSLKHFSRTFHKAKGVTAREFRKDMLPI